MKTVEKIEEIIKNLEDNKTEEINSEEQDIQNKINLINECRNAITDGEDRDDVFFDYDFEEIIKLIDSSEYKIEDLRKKIQDIKNVIIVKKELGDDFDIALEESQVDDIVKMVESIEKIKVKEEEKLEEINSKKVDKNETKIAELEALKDILEGKGRRRYYTKEMINAFTSEVDLTKLDPAEAMEILEGFFETRNMSCGVTTNKPKEEPVEFKEIINLYKEYVGDYFNPGSIRGEDGETYDDPFIVFLNAKKKYIVYDIDIDNTIDVLEWLKKKGLLYKFDREALIDITVYGDVNMLEAAYAGSKLNSSSLGDKIYTRKFSVFWTNYSEDKRRFIRARRGYSRRRLTTGERVERDVNVYGQEILENEKLIKRCINEGLISEKESNNDDALLRPNWRLRKNIFLAKTFGLGELTCLPITYLYAKDEEKSINSAIELGLLNVAKDPESKMIDEGIAKYSEFMANAEKKGLYNQSIRDYYLRHTSELIDLSEQLVKYLSYIIETEGYEALYNYLFSEKVAGRAQWSVLKDIIGKIKEYDLDYTLYSLEDNPEVINNYQQIDESLIDYELDLKSQEEEYIDEKILDDELIKKLEDDYRVYDELTQGDDTISLPNEYVYNFNGRLISRKKVLHIASILKGLYGYLDKDMVLYAVMKDSYFSKEHFEYIKEAIKGKEKEIVL